MPKTRELRYLALEGFMVLFGVLAALAVDEWREEMTLDRRTEVALARLEAEIAHNRAELADLATVAEQRLMRMRELARDPSTRGPLADLVDRFGGYRTPDLQEAAWTRLNASALADRIDPAYLERAWLLYNYHRQIASLDEQVNRLVFGEVYHDPARLGIAFRISDRIMSQQVIWAREALEAYGSFTEAPPEPTGGRP